jgi:hypothetical protein
MQRLRISQVKETLPVSGLPKHLRAAKVSDPAVYLKKRRASIAPMTESAS